MKIGKNSPKIGFSPDFLFLGYFFPIFVPGPIWGPIWFPISGRRPETYFLAGRLDRKPSLHTVETNVFHCAASRWGKQISNKQASNEPTQYMPMNGAFGMRGCMRACVSLFRCYNPGPLFRDRISHFKPP